jgi:DNA-directed RNA polymerase subunit N (RpoN/RPB10)
MIIPIKCFTCGKVLADKWTYYVEACKKMEADAKEGSAGGAAGDEVTRRIAIFEKLHLDRICCRRHMLGHVDMIDVI